MNEEDKDLKPEEQSDGTGDETLAEDGQSDEKRELTDEEVFENLPSAVKDRITKLERDNENYKTGMLKYKSQARSLSKQEEVKEEPKVEEWDETSLKFRQETVSEAQKAAREAAREVLEEANEKKAINKFLKENPDLADDDKWNGVISNYTPKNGKGSVTSIMTDLKRAYNLTRLENGEIDQLATKAERRGLSKGKAEATVSNLHTVGHKGTKADKTSEQVDERAERLCKTMPPGFRFN